MLSRAAAPLRHLPVILALCAVPVVFAGCAVVKDVQTELFSTEEVNLTESSYAAADILAQQSRAHVGAATPVQVLALADTAAPGEVTPFGQAVASQIGARLVQLGYNVYSGSLDQMEYAGVRPDGSPQPLMTGVAPSTGTITPTGSMKPGAVQLGGTYVRGKNNAMVSLQMVQASTGRILAAHNYTLPMTREMRDMTMTAADRMKSSGNAAPAPAAQPGVQPAAPVDAVPLQ